MWRRFHFRGEALQVGHKGYYEVAYPVSKAN
jgi:hypothetical protein